MQSALFKTATVVLTALILASCSLLEDNAQYFAPVAAEVVLFGAPEDSADVAAEYGVQMDAPTSIMVAIGHLTDPGGSSSSPFSGEAVTGATVSVTTPDGTFDLKEDSSSPGLYYLTTFDAAEFKYTIGAEYAVNMNFSGQDYWIKLVAADAIVLETPAELGEYHAPNTDLQLSWKNPVDNVVTTMFDAEGNEVYDNLPRDLNGLFSFLTQGESTSLTLPGHLFKDQQAYGVALAGLQRSTVDEAHVSTNLNYLVTNAVSGAGAMTVVTTIEIPDIPEMPEE